MPEIMTSAKNIPTTPGLGDHAPGASHDRPRQPDTQAVIQVRSADLEPYVGLKYLSRLFKLMAVVLVLLLVSEVITGFVTNGLEALPTLLGEVSRLVVFAGLLWGSGDLAILFIDIGHDLRATRILMGRQLAHHTEEHHAQVDPVMATMSPPSIKGAPLADRPTPTV